VMLGSAGGLLAVAQFEAAWRGFQPGVYLAGALGTAATPFVAAAQPSVATAITRRGVRVCAGLGAAGGALLALLAPLVSRVLYAANDPVVVDCVRILAAALPVTLVAFYVQTAVLLPRRAFSSLLVAAGTLMVATLGLTAWFGDDPRGCALALVLGQVAFLAALGVGVLRLRSAPAS
jgi:O-antigen/teichoic acid export membrane protein